MKFKQRKQLVYGLAVAIFICAAIFLVPKLFKVKYASSQISSVEKVVATSTVEVPKETIKHIKTPEPLKAIYMTSCVVSTPHFREELVSVAEKTEINAIVIDIKDFTGTLSYEPHDPSLTHAWESARCGTKDMKEFVAELHNKGIYVIGRVTVFQDPHFTKLHPELAVKSAATGQPWKDRKGLSFLDVGGKQTWEYVVAIARDAYGIGFDEINFDYIRFPSDGNMKDARYTLSTGTKADQLEKFFKYLHEQTIAIGVVTSADVFGMTTTNNDDLNIGQVLERTLPYFDYVAPMVYPSHYPPNFNGWKDPNKYPYDLIHFVMKRAVERAEATTTAVTMLDNQRIGTSTPARYTHEPQSVHKLRPWLQDFNYGGIYGVPEVKAQIKATYDSGLSSWMLWAPSNKYTKGALLQKSV